MKKDSLRTGNYFIYGKLFRTKPCLARLVRVGFFAVATEQLSKGKIVKNEHLNILGVFEIFHSGYIVSPSPFSVKVAYLP